MCFSSEFVITLVATKLDPSYVSDLVGHLDP